jgi:hypothetical protein
MRIRRLWSILFPAVLAAATMTAQVQTLPWMKSSQAKIDSELSAKYGESQHARIVKGVQQAAEYWRTEDGDAPVFEEFVRENFAGDQQTLDILFGRYEYLLEQLNGHMQEINREFRQQSDLDLGKVYPFDEIFAAYSPNAHVIDDFFQNKLAFVVLLNFPLTTLDERLTQGERWTRRQWAEARLALQFSRRVPADVNQAISAAGTDAEQYISEYNIYMHHIVDAKGNRLFPAGMRLLSHWNLRDEIKADYADAANGLAKQRTIVQVMERIVTQTIPESVINNPYADWNPFDNTVAPASVHDADAPDKINVPISAAAEPDTRYATLLNVYRASRKADPYFPNEPTLIARKFNIEREIPEARVKSIFENILTSPLVPKMAKLIQKRLGRPLEPFDIWYNGFKPQSKYSEAELDKIVSAKYPTPDAYKADIPNMLLKLGFSKERAEYLAANIIVDPARGSGHAMGAGMKSAHPHLRTRVGKSGMDYKGFNIAVHEMGHNVEQTFSLNMIDHYLLNGVPNTAFTEAIAFVFQAHDLDLLGITSNDPQAETMKTLNDFWMTYEIAGVGLVDMGVWHWMYDHPDAAPAQLKEAAIAIAKDIWNKYYAPVFGKKDILLLGIYSHMIDSFLYLPDYTIGYLIANQIEEQVKKSGSIGKEIERIVASGSIAPDLWMKNATGSPVSADALLEETEKALKAVNEK